MDAKEFGAFLAQVRRERNMTQAELAQQLHVTDKAVSRWERGIGLPDINTLEPLADVLGVTRQTAVSAFQFGDGLSNLIWPTSSTVFAYLAMANLRYDKYLKIAVPLFAVLSVLAVIFVAGAQLVGFGPF